VGELQWFGVTLWGDPWLVFAVRAENEEEARGLAKRSINVDPEDPALSIEHRHEDHYQQILTERYGREKQAVHVQQFTIELFPGKKPVKFG
jgi:hypothetical protein